MEMLVVFLKPGLQQAQQANTQSSFRVNWEKCGYGGGISQGRMMHGMLLGHH